MLISNSPSLFSFQSCAAICMQEEKPNQVEQFKIPRERIDKFFKPGTPAQKIEDTIVKALELYRKRQREMER